MLSSGEPKAGQRALLLAGVLFTMVGNMAFYIMARVLLQTSIQYSNYA
jgi:hypothetical protein